jgi:hypothetical protein
MRPDGRIDTREAAKIYGCCRNHLVSVMGRHGYRPLIETTTGRNGGVASRFWWNPSEVAAVRRASEKAKAENGKRNLATFNNWRTQAKLNGLRNKRLERLRKYYQAKAASRAAA